MRIAQEADKLILLSSPKQHMKKAYSF